MSDNMEEIKVQIFHKADERPLVEEHCKKMLAHKVQIMSMMGRIKSGWRCKICGKTGPVNDKGHLMEHVKIYPL